MLLSRNVLKSIISRVASQLITFILKRIKSHPFFYTLLYRIKNREAFSNLWEHEKMLFDKNRIEAYYTAISNYVRAGDTVIDLGTGSGILAFFASFKHPAKIYAIDHSGFIKNAELVAAHNMLAGMQFIQMHSKDFESGSKIDVIIHEQIGVFLFNEYMITNIIDLRDRLLKKDGLILPSKFELFIEPVKIKDDRLVPFIWQHSIHGIDFSCLKETVNKDTERYYRTHTIDPEYIEFFLCEPERIYRFDLSTIKEDEIPHRLGYSRAVKIGGQLDGFILYFNAIFDDETVLTTDPTTKNRANSWPLHLFRVNPTYYKSGQTITFGLDLVDLSNVYSWRWCCH